KKVAAVLFTVGVGISILCAIPHSVLAESSSAFTLTPVESGMQLKGPDGHVIFNYVTKRPENIGLTSPSAAFFDPVNTPSGERVTNAAPDDHHHHRGIFLGFLDSEFHQPDGSYEAPPNHHVLNY